MEGGAGFNIIYGGNGNNVLLGGPDGNLFLTNAGEVGDNLVIGGAGNDAFSTFNVPFEAGDRFEGGAGDDYING
ncbi:MAG: hypothetical protein LC808_01770, partial [Actinobacteria bacterium]|nr:hypothetical protein [Actinomycetota bacterium]